MSKLYCDNDKYGYQCDFPISEAYNSAVKDLVRRSYEEFGGKWEDFVFKNEFDFIKKENMLEIESNLLDFGYKFEPSAMSSQESGRTPTKLPIFMTKISVLSMKKPRLRQLTKMDLNFVGLGTTLCPMILILEEQPYTYARSIRF